MVLAWTDIRKLGRGVRFEEKIKSSLLNMLSLKFLSPIRKKYPSGSWRCRDAAQEILAELGVIFIDMIVVSIRS